MGTADYLEAMDEAIRFYKQDKREDTEKMLLNLLEVVRREYLKVNPSGTYLSIYFGEDVIHVNNEYWKNDAAFPIHAYMDDNTGFKSLSVSEVDEDDE